MKFQVSRRPPRAETIQRVKLAFDGISRLEFTVRHVRWQLRPSRHWSLLAPKSAWFRVVRSFISEALGALLKVRIDHILRHLGPSFMPV